MEQNIEDLLQREGVDPVDSFSNMLDSHLPLEYFDDTTFDPRTTEEWLSFRVYSLPHFLLVFFQQFSSSFIVCLSHTGGKGRSLQSADSAAGRNTKLDVVLHGGLQPRTWQMESGNGEQR